MTLFSTTRSSSSSSSSLIVAIVIITTFLLLYSSCCNNCCVVNAKELQVTKEWQVIGENDTIPSGMHVRIDMTTGEKWVKEMDEDDEDDDVVSSIATISTTIIQPDGTVQQQETTTTTTPSTSSTSIPKYDYEMMYRALSKLPKEEQDRMGGLPEIPQYLIQKQQQQQQQQQEQQNDFNFIFQQMNPTEREIFQLQMKTLWLKRQSELKQIELESIMNMPDMIKDRIKRLKTYLQNPIQQLHDMQSSSSLVNEDTNNEKKNMKQTNNDNVDEDDSNNNSVTDIISVLKDLEYQLSDIDNARDFHTLGGWPLLVALISDDVHNQHHDQDHPTNDITTTTTPPPPFPTRLTAKKHAVQAHAAWTVGSVVKNTEEFFSYAIEPISLEDVVASSSSSSSSFSFVTIPTTTTTTSSSSTTSSTTTAIDLLLDLFLTSRVDDNSWEIRLLQQKALYGIGSLLRGNRMAQIYLCNSTKTTTTTTTKNNNQDNNQDKDIDDTSLYYYGPTRLALKVQELTQVSKRTSATVKLIHRLVSLASDIISSVEHHHQEEEEKEKEAESNNRMMIINAFTSQEWCEIILTLVGTNQFTPIPLAEALATTVVVIAPHCQRRQFWTTPPEQQQQKEEEVTASTVSVQHAIHSFQNWQSDWKKDINDFDSDHFHELIQLVDTAIQALQK